MKPTKTQAFLEILETGDTKAIFEYIDNDPDYKERIAKGETPKKPETGDRTREEITAEILELLNKLYEKANHEKLRAILHKQPIHDGNLYEDLASYVRNEKKSKKFDETLLYLDIFNYGYISGKQADRARRKRGIDNE